LKKSFEKDNAHFIQIIKEKNDLKMNRLIATAPPGKSGSLHNGYESAAGSLFSLVLPLPSSYFLTNYVHWVYRWQLRSGNLSGKFLINTGSV